MYSAIKKSWLTDAHLIILLKEGSHAAYTEIYQRYWASMYLFARKLLNDPIVAKDVIQEVLLYIWTNSENLKENTPIAPYLYTAIRNKALTYISRQKLQDKYLDSLSAFIKQGEYTADKNIREQELQEVIDKAIDALPKKMKQIFQLSKVEQLSNKEIATQLEISDKTVRNQLSTALKTIKLKIITR
ncbi:MAG: RNA polymerase sigma-70 factor [Bacteroidota bacterium]